MKLGEALSFRNGKTSPDRSEGGMYQVHGSNGVIGYCNQSNAPAGATVIGRVGSYCGNVHFLQSDSWVTDNAIFAFPKADQDPRYWYFVLCHLKLGKLRHGSGQPLLNQEILSGVDFDPQTLSEQRRIAGVLGALDDKIESNQNLTEIILSLIGAQIDYELSDGSGDLFPVSELAKFVNGGAYTKEASGTGRMVIRIADLNSGPSASTIYNDIDVPGDRLAHFGDLLMSWSGSLGIYVWVRDEAIVNQHIFKVICTNFPAWLVHNRLNAVLHRFRSIAADKATTMGHIQRKHLDETFVEVPVTKLGQLSHLCAPLWNRFISAQLESMQLAALRDALLPELMSGRMRVDEAGRLVSEALDEEVRSV